MNEYQDQWSRYHHKPTDGINPSSGNGWIYTAYAEKAGIAVDKPKLRACFNLCANFLTKKIRRNPENNTVPISRDEILGMVSLKLLTPVYLNGWSFSPFPIPRFSLLKLIKQLYELRPSLVRQALFSPPSSVNYYKLPSLFPKFGIYYLSFKHRNYFWQNNLDQIYRFAFSVPLVDRDFILNSWGKFQWFNPVHLFYKAIAFVDSKTGTDSGIRFLKYGKSAKAMAEEFPADHPITQKVLNEI